MITNYNEFIFESLILESEVVFSDKFRDILKKIKSPISDKLISIENKDFDVTSNFIDVDESNDKVTFVPDRRAQSFISDPNVVYGGGGGVLSNNMRSNGRIFGLLNYTPSGSNAFRPGAGSSGVILASAKSSDGTKTYHLVDFDGEKTVINSENLNREGINKIWDKKNRQSVRIGRSVRALLTASGESPTQAEIEEFVNLYKSTFDKMNDIFSNFQLVQGDRIPHWYNYRNYYKRSGTLSSSCMSDVRSSYFDIYAENPDKCKLLILKEGDDKIKARALIWFLDKPKGIVFMDRIYTNNDSDVNLFHDYARSHGIHYKYYNNSSDSSPIVHPESGANTYLDMAVNLKRGDQYDGHYHYYPYLDTLKYYYPSTGVLSNDQDDGDCVMLESTSGGYEGRECDRCGGDEEIECYECDGRGSYECPECEGSGEVECDTCDGKGTRECPECDGEGEVDGEECPLCQGKGDIECPECEGSGEVECDRCNGDGEIECPECDGRGMLPCPDCQ